MESRGAGRKIIAQRFSAGKDGFINSEPASAGDTKRCCAAPTGLDLNYSCIPSAEALGYDLSRLRRSRLAMAQGDRKTEKQKLEQALAIFTELKMPREREAVQAELKEVAGG